MTMWFTGLPSFWVQLLGGHFGHEIDRNLKLIIIILHQDNLLLLVVLENLVLKKSS